MFRPRRSAESTAKRLFFATDIHGSEACFRKFINAAKFYSVDYLVLGGDMLGKRLVPVLRDSDRTYRVSYLGHEHRALTRRELADIFAHIRARGEYPVVGTADELAALGDECHREQVFRQVAQASVAGWLELAADRLRGTHVRCFMAPGNDDFLELDNVITGCDQVEFAENRCIALDEPYEMITTGYSNPTPWDTERELPEEALGQRLQAMVDAATSGKALIAVIHPPPYDSQLDLAPRLTPDLAVVTRAGEAELIPVGSTAVREFIEHYAPLLALHGHVHESAGATYIGGTLCVNPGSEYTQGILAGTIVQLEGGRVRSQQFVSG